MPAAAYAAALALEAEELAAVLLPAGTHRAQVAAFVRELAWRPSRSGASAPALRVGPGRSGSFAAADVDG
jgi:hypothetical protein